MHATSKINLITIGYYMNSILIDKMKKYII